VNLAFRNPRKARISETVSPSLTAAGIITIRNLMAERPDVHRAPHEIGAREIGAGFFNG